MPISIRAATEGDLPILATMNKRLIEDEGHRNPMSLDQLLHRMQSWLSSNWAVHLFLQADNTIVGYSLHQLRRDDYFANEVNVYLRQFFIERAYRDQGLGSEAFRAISKTFPENCTVVIEVLAVNPRGQKFWQSLGFDTYCTTMKLRPTSSSD
jgi:GNAT superfamily N-acetyltransferase